MLELDVRVDMGAWFSIEERLEAASRLEVEEHRLEVGTGMRLGTAAGAEGEEKPKKSGALISFKLGVRIRYSLRRCRGASSMPGDGVVDSETFG